MKIQKSIVATVAVVLALAGCGGSSEPESVDGAPAGTIKVWVFGSLDNTSALNPLKDGFEAKYKDVKIELLGQPAENYYAMLQAAVASGQGPDVFSMFPGGYQKQFEQYSLDLSDLIDKSDLDSVDAQYYSSSGSTDSDVFGVPITAGMYMALYNKDLLAEVGVDSIPTTWDELDATCAKVKAAGKTCLGYGSESGTGAFPAIFDWSYLATSEDLAGWDGLISGSQPYDSPGLRSQLERWASLHKQGYTNDDVMTWRDARPGFVAGDVAMIMGGSWDAAWAQENLGDAAVAAPAPFSEKPIETLVQLPDAGFSVSAETKNKPATVAFIDYIISEEGQQIVSKAGQVPSRTGIPVLERINNDLLTQASEGGWKIVPMFDNFIAPSVNDALERSLNQVLAEQITPSEGLKELDAATDAVPVADRVEYHLAGK